MGLTQPTIGRHIEALENEAGQQLFTRSQRGLEPTASTLALKPLAEAMAASAGAIRRAATENKTCVSGSVRISASDVMSIEVLPDILAPLFITHNKLAIELSVSDAVEDLLHRKADIALRMVEPRQEALLVKYIGEIPIGCFARRDVIAVTGRPETFNALSQYPTVGFDREFAYIRETLKNSQNLQVPEFTFRSDSNLAQLAAIRAGCGIGLCQSPIGRRDPNLIELLEGQIQIRLPLWIAMHEDLRHSPRYRTTFDCLVKGMKKFIKVYN